MIGVPRLRLYILALGRLINEKVTPQRHITVQRHTLAYLMVDASGVVFGSVLWGHGRIFLIRSIHSTVLGGVINFQEGYNITSQIE